ncbi:MAG: glycosyltransferase [Minisyncoccia bacterium]
MDKLKIALVTDQPPWTGIGRYAEELYYLIKDYYDVKFIYLGAHMVQGNYYENLNYIKYTKKFYLIPKIKKYNYKMFKIDPRFENYIKHYLGAFYPIDSISEKTIITIHDMYKRNFFLSLKAGIRELGSIFFINRDVKKFLNILNKNPYIIAISNITAEDILKIGYSNKIKVIYHWIDKNKFKPRDKLDCKKILGLKEDINYLLSVSGSGANKRLDLIKIFANSLPEKWRLIKIGAPIKSKKVLNYGKVNDDLYPLFFNASEAYLHMSDIEGFGIPLLEALGSGIPIIARKTKINNEILENFPIYLMEDTKQYYQKNMNDILQMIKAPLFKKDELNKLLNKYDVNNARKAYIDFYNYVYNKIK